MSQSLYIDRLAQITARVRASAAFAITVCVLPSVLGTSVVAATKTHGASHWTSEERKVLRSLTLSALEPLPPDPSNRYGDDPRAATLGRALFFDTRLSGNGKVSCATCHIPSLEFQDGTPLAKGVGTTTRRTMPVAGTAHSPWLFWDGRSDSQWAQALGPLESPVEHGGDRTSYAHAVAAYYSAEYTSVFGVMPDLGGLPHHAGPVADTVAAAEWARMPAERREDISRVYANIGKAIAAYERRIDFGPSRFDRYVDAELAGRPHTETDSFSRDEEAGLRIFIGKGTCTNCHNGALLTDQHFHNTGVPVSLSVVSHDSGRSIGVRQAIAGEFNCASRYSDARPEQCSELLFAVTDGEELVRAYKTPTLRNVANRAPYMHAGQFVTLEDVVAHYNRAPKAPFGHSELRRLRLSATEEQQLVAFLRALSGPLATPAEWLEAPKSKR